MTESQEPTFRILEVVLYHAGKAYTYPAHEQFSVTQPQSRRIPLITINGSAALPMWLAVDSEGTIIDDYLSLRLALLDPYNTVMGTPRPGLWYLGESDIPTTVAFSAVREGYHFTPAGIWILALRTATK